MGQRLPLMMEFAVPPTEPYLVSSSRGLMWIPRSRSGRIRAAVRESPSTGDFFRDVIRETTSRGLASEWGNVHDLSPDGIKAAIEHLKFYGLDKIVLLASPQTSWETINPQWKVHDGNTAGAIFEVPIEAAPWLEPGYVVAIPIDRSYLGFVMEVGETHLVSVIHNASRGLGIARLS
jgi:hypothetical protein